MKINNSNGKRAVSISLKDLLVTNRKRSLGQGNIFAPVVILFTGEGVWPIACWDTPQRAEPSPGADTPKNRHPQLNACWEIRATSGRYASYWNAYLFRLFCVLFQCNPYVLAAYKACLEKRSVVNFISVDFFEKHARMVVETALSGNREETMKHEPQQLKFD